MPHGNKGRVFTREHRAKISAGVRAFHAQLRAQSSGSKRYIPRITAAGYRFIFTVNDRPPEGCDKVTLAQYCVHAYFDGRAIASAARAMAGRAPSRIAAEVHETHEGEYGTGLRIARAIVGDDENADEAVVVPVLEELAAGIGVPKQKDNFHRSRRCRLLTENEKRRGYADR